MITKFLFGAIILSAGISSQAFASSTAFTLSPYNALVFGAFADTSDYGGGIAAKGSLTISGASVAGSLMGEAFSQFPGAYTLVSGGNLSATNGTLVTGDAYGGGSSNNFSLTVSSGYSYKHAPTADPLDFSALQASADSTSAALAAQTSNASCTFDGYSTTTCTANLAGVNYVTINNPSLLGANRTVDINLASASSFLVLNIAGTSDTITNYGIYINGNGANGDSTTTLAHNVLFNYYQATSLSVYSVVGSVLAPYAAVTSAQSGQIDGNLIAGSFSGAEELHNFGYEGALPVTTPEPAPIFALGFALIGLGLIGRRRRAK
jgi:choice-of-anchor A domain-containing protein